MEQFSQLSDLLPDVLLHCRECPDDAALHSLVHSATDFLRSTGAWTIVRSGDASEGDPKVVLKNLPFALLERCLRCSISGKVIPAGSYTCSSSGVLTFSRSYIPTTTEADSVVCDIVMVPDYHSKVVPPDLIREYGMGIVYGAIGDLLLMPSVPYSNPDLGAYYKVKNEDEIRYANAKISQCHTGVNRGFYA